MTGEQYPGFVVTQSPETGIRTIRVNVPKRKNAFKSQMFRDFIKILNEAEADQDTKIVVVTGWHIFVHLINGIIYHLLSNYVNLHCS